MTLCSFVAKELELRIFKIDHNATLFVSGIGYILKEENRTTKISFNIKKINFQCVIFLLFIVKQIFDVM